MMRNPAAGDELRNQDGSMAMIAAVTSAWPLFLGLLLLMAGNALQGAALGIRGDDFSSTIYGIVASGYFAGFLIGSHYAPKLLQRVGHIRVFAALGSLISVAFILYIAFKDPIFWFIMRVVVGFGYSGVYIVAESWLNSTSTNADRGKTLSAYMFIQYIGVVIGMMMLNFGDPKEAVLFILMSVMVSLSFAPILLSVTPAPLYQTAKPMSFKELFHASPLGFVGGAILGSVFGVMFGMSSYYGKQMGLSVAEVSVFLTSLYLGGAVLMIPIGWISDRMDRRWLIIWLSLAASALAACAMLAGDLVLFEIGGVRVFAMAVIAFGYGGLANPIYSIIVAHANDFLENEQMSAAAGRLVFLNGLGAMFGPYICGFVMDGVGPEGFWLAQSGLCLVITIYGVYRSTQRPSIAVEDTSPYVATSRSFTPVAAEMTQEVYIELADASAEEGVDEEDDMPRPAKIEMQGDEISEEEADERMSREAIDND